MGKRGAGGKAERVHDVRHADGDDQHGVATWHHYCSRRPEWEPD